MKPPLSQDAGANREKIHFRGDIFRKKFIVTAILSQVIEAGDVGEAMRKAEGEVLFGKLGNLPSLKNVSAYEIPLD